MYRKRRRPGVSTKLITRERKCRDGTQPARAKTRIGPIGLAPTSVRRGAEVVDVGGLACLADRIEIGQESLYTCRLNGIMAAAGPRFTINLGFSGKCGFSNMNSITVCSRAKHVAATVCRRILAFNKPALQVLLDDPLRSPRQRRPESRRKDTVDFSFT